MLRGEKKFRLFLRYVNWPHSNQMKPHKVMINVKTETRN